MTTTTENICPECDAKPGEAHDGLCWSANDLAGTESMSAAHWRAKDAEE
jgi:hypothetical protein